MQNNAENNQLLETLMKKLSPEDRARVKALLSDRQACEKILSSPEAQDIIRRFKGGK
jgi:hypothetical protein